MYLPQIRSVRWSAEVRRSMRPTFEHRQRKDLCILMVLVRHLEHIEWNILGLPTSRHYGPQIETILIESPFPFSSVQTSQSRLRRMPDRGLVRTVPAGQKHRSPNIQGADIRAGRQPHRQSARRLTIDRTNDSDALSCSLNCKHVFPTSERSIYS